MKKIIAILLCAVMTSAVFAACNNDSDDNSSNATSTQSVVTESSSEPENESSAPPEEINYLDRIYTGSDYSGKTFTILTSGVNQTAISEVVYNEDLKDSENFPEVINEAIKRRNDAVYDLLGVEIEEVYFPDSHRYNGDTLERIRTAVNGGDHSFQAISVCLYDCGTLATQNYLYDLTTLENINLDNPWWDSSFSDTVRIGGRQYFMLGDIGINFKNSTPCVYYNKSLFERLHLEDPQELAYEGKWTIDKAIELSTSYNEDTNGTTGIQWDDCYGWAGQNDDMPSMLYGAGVRILSPDSDGYPYLTLWSETANNAVEKVLELMLNPDYYVSGNDYFGKTGSYQWPMEALEANFIAGKVLFYSGGISTAINLSAMEDTFAIVPVPKLTEEQDGYYSLLNTWTTNAYGIATNNTQEEAEFAAAVMEAMGYYSWEGHADSLAVVYYERVLKMQKLQADEKSAEILDLCFNTRGCELGSVFQVGSVTGTKNVNSILGDLIANKQKGAFRSTYEQYEDILTTDAEAIAEYFKS